MKLSPSFSLIDKFKDKEANVAPVEIRSLTRREIWMISRIGCLAYLLEHSLAELAARRFLYALTEIKSLSKNYFYSLKKIVCRQDVFRESLLVLSTHHRCYKKYCDATNIIR